MKYLFLLIPIIAYAADNCDEDLSSVVATAKTLSLPNCYTKKNARQISRDSEEFCASDCRDQFAKFYGQKPEMKTSELQKMFLNSSFDEYKKNIINNLVSVAKLRSLPSTGSSFEKSIKSCDIKSQLQKMDNCKSKTAKSLLSGGQFFENIQKSLATELAKIVSEDERYKPESALLKRSTPQCFIPEKDILLFNAQVIEEEISPEMVQFFQELDSTKNLADSLANPNFSKLYNGDAEAFKVSLLNHPILSTFVSSPKDFSDFFKSVPKPFDTKSLRAKLYSKKNGQLLDEKMADNCSASFDSFFQSICSEDFEKGNLSLDQFNNLKKLDLPKPDDSEFASNETLVETNASILALCEKPASGSVNLTPTLGKISSTLLPKYAEMPLTTYQTQKFESELGNASTYLCSNNSSCDEKEFNCKILKKYLNSKTPGSYESKLAKSHNDEVNKLLRSMIGDTSKIDPKTKEILVTSGILPKEDGTFVAQPEIPERQPEYFSKPSSNAVAQTQAPKLNTPVQNTATTKPNFYDSPYSNVKNNSGSQTQNQPVVPDISDIVQNTAELKTIQDEIRRRLTDFGGKPVSREAATKIVNDSFKNQGQSLKPSQVSRIVDRMLPAQQQNVATANSQGPVNETKAQVSGGDTLREKWKKEQENNALMGMAGAQTKVSRDPASVTNAVPKDLTKVALNLPEEPMVNLSELFNQKIDQNDSETQLLKVLLRSQNNFLLQVKSVNFRVVFMEKNKFSILLDSGDNKEADRLRPQLEMFLKKLKT